MKVFSLKLTLKKRVVTKLSHNLHKNNIGIHLQTIGKRDKLSTSYDNIILLGDPNVDPEEATMSEFLDTYSLKTLDSQKPRKFLRVLI